MGENCGARGYPRLWFRVPTHGDDFVADNLLTSFPCQPDEGRFAVYGLLCLRIEGSTYVVAFS